MNYKIPSKWTKEDFVLATWFALLNEESNCHEIAEDLQDCVLFGFTHVRSNGFRVDYAKYANRVAISD